MQDLLKSILVAGDHTSRWGWKCMVGHGVSQEHYKLVQFVRSVTLHWLWDHMRATCHTEMLFIDIAQTTFNVQNLKKKVG